MVARLSHLFLALVFTLVFAGCTKSDNKKVQGFNAELSASKNSAHENTLIKMDRTRLNEDLVWSIWLERVDGSIYKDLQSGMPSESIVVFFELSADQKYVHLFEKKANPEDPRKANLIDRFPVTDINAETLTFDYSQGLSRQFFRTFIDPKIVSDFESSYSSVYDFQNSDGVVTFSQLLKLKDANASTLIMHHAFRLFDDPSGFAEVKIPHPLSVGIMPASFDIDTNTDEPIAIRRWDIRKSVTFFISSNTPKEFIPAIVEGLNWWNQALGTEFIRIEVLTKPVNWGDARVNIVQWSEDPTVCGTASAIGPSEANPITGQIYSGKIIFCGRTLFPTYDKGILPGTISREDYYKKLLSWSAAHEMGHVLGFAHNFKGKLYRDPHHPELLNSTVMDYPFPNEISNYSKVGPADLSKLAVSYLRPGQAAALEELKTFAICSDEETGFMPDCTHFVPGGLTPIQMIDRYLSLLQGGIAFVQMENKARAVVIKQALTIGDTHAAEALVKLFRIYPGNKDILTNELKSLAETSKALFVQLPTDQQLAVLRVLADCILSTECALSNEAQKIVVGVIADFQTLAAFKTLQNLKSSVTAAIQKSRDAKETTDLYKLSELIKVNLKKFWRQKVQSL